MNIILLEPADFTAAGMASIGGRRAEHIRKVLRARPGSKLRIGMLNGPAGEGTITGGDEKMIDLSCRFAPAPPSPGGITLLLALPRPKVLKRLWAPLASLALAEIIITNANRVEKNYFATHWLNPDAYIPLLKEGLEQAGHTRMPRVRVCRRLKPLVEDELAALAATRSLLLADLAGAAIQPLTDAALKPDVILAVGPEGGWVPTEREMLGRCGFRPVSLGPRPLRSDVACLAALGIITCRRNS